MSKFAQGQLVSLKSDSTVTGAIVTVTLAYPENRYQVFTAQRLQSYYELQLISQDADEMLETVSAERFHAGLTASLIRNPTISSIYPLYTSGIDY